MRWRPSEKRNRQRLPATELDRQELARSVYEASHLTGSFTLRSGQVGGEYFDKFQFTSDPVLLRAISEGLAGLVPQGTDVLAGLQLGGVPLAAALSLETGIPAVYVRLQRKAYGTEKIAEGAAVDGRRVVVVEDVVTTGGQIIESAGELRTEGAEVSTVLAVIDRESGGRESLAAAGIELRALFSMSELGAPGRRA